MVAAVANQPQNVKNNKNNLDFFFVNSNTFKGVVAQKLWVLNKENVQAILSSFY